MHNGEDNLYLVRLSVHFTFALIDIMYLFLKDSSMFILSAFCGVWRVSAAHDIELLSIFLCSPLCIVLPSFTLPS